MKKISLFMLMIFGLFILFAQEAPKEEPKNEVKEEAQPAEAAPEAVKEEAQPEAVQPAETATEAQVKEEVWATMERWATKSNRQYQESEFVREFTMFPFIKWMYPRKWFDDTLWVPFENTKMPIPIGAHEYLTKRYGNYMELPPEKDRHPEHRIVFMDLDTPYIKYRGEKYYTKKK